MSVKEIVSGERKVRIRTRIKLGNINFKIKELNMDRPTNVSKEKGDLILDIDHILDDFNNIESLFEQCDAEMPGAVLFVSGAIAYRLKKSIKCTNCFGFLIDTCDSYEVENDSEIDYFDSINRGSLLKPSLFLFTLIRVCLAFFEVYIRPELGYSIKNPSSCQLREVYFNFLNGIKFFDNFLNCNSCKMNRNYIFKGVLKILTNICLNNFCKLVTDANKLEELKKREKSQAKSAVKNNNEKLIKNQKLINLTGKI